MTEDNTTVLMELSDQDLLDLRRAVQVHMSWMPGAISDSFNEERAMHQANYSRYKELLERIENCLNRSL